MTSAPLTNKGSQTNEGQNNGFQNNEAQNGEAQNTEAHNNEALLAESSGAVFENQNSEAVFDQNQADGPLTGESLLATQAITMRFGGVTAVHNLSIEVNPGEIVALIGPNGAGKTTAFNMITGVYTPTEGRIMYSGKDITGKRPDQITQLGIARTFQNIRLFKQLSVMENILIAHHLRLHSNFLSASLRLPRYRGEERKMRENAHRLINEFGLSRYEKDIASSLPYGLQRRLEIARALATDPQLLLLDEPAAGMNPKETEELTGFIREIKEKYHLTVFLIEHHMDLVMEISDRIYVLDFGETIAKGTANEVQNDPKVIEAYLGVDEDA